MVDESDGIEEAIEGQTRLLITAAAQAGDRIARMREDALRRAQATSERDARELQSRLAAEQRAVRADLAGVQRADWWENASPERITQAYESAVAWRDEEPEAARAEQRIIDELSTRHGITPEQLQAQVQAEHEAGRREPTFSVYEFRNEADTSRDITKAEALDRIERMSERAQPRSDGRGSLDDVRGWIGTDNDVDRAIAAKFPQIMTEDQLAQIERAEAEHQRQAEQRDRAEAKHQRQAEQRDRAEAAALMAEATAEENRAQERRDDRPDRPALGDEHDQRAQDAREEAATKYDSAERRASTAADLESRGHDHETVARQMRADVSQGAPATDATKDGRTSRARKSRGRGGANRQRERGGLSR